MNALNELIDSIRHSPQLPAVLSVLQQQWSDEQQRREQFYQDMTEEQKTEFIEGDMIVHSPARNRHIQVTQWIFMLLDTYVRLRKLGEVKVEKCLVVFPRNDYEPDIVFFSDEKARCFEWGTLKFPVPDLIVEVLSESTEHRDRGVKFIDYAVNGVGEYWIVDADRGVIEQYLLRESEYELAMKSATGLLKSTVITGFEADIEAFFDSQKNLKAMQRLFG